jgi:hypothetical protein
MKIPPPKDLGPLSHNTAQPGPREHVSTLRVRKWPEKTARQFKLNFERRMTPQKCLRLLAQNWFSLRAAGAASGGFSTPLLPRPRSTRMPFQATSGGVDRYVQYGVGLRLLPCATQYKPPNVHVWRSKEKSSNSSVI